MKLDLHKEKSHLIQFPKKVAYFLQFAYLPFHLHQKPFSLFVSAKTKPGEIIYIKIKWLIKIKLRKTKTLHITSIILWPLSTHETTCVILLVLIKTGCNRKQLNILNTFLEYLKFRIVCCFWRWFIPFFIHVLVLTFSVLILLRKRGLVNQTWLVFLAIKICNWLMNNSFIIPLNHINSLFCPSFFRSTFICPSESCF